MQFLKKIRINALVTAALYVVLGLLFVLLPGLTMQTICYIMAAALALGGVVYIIDYFKAWDIEYKPNGLATGILALLGALFLFLKTEVVIAAIPVLLGFAVIVSGVLKVQNTVVLYRQKDKGWIFVLVLAVLCLIVGIVLIENPFTVARTLVVIIGAGLLYSGVSDLVIVFVMTKKVRDIKKHVQKAAGMGGPRDEEA